MNQGKSAIIGGKVLLGDQLITNTGLSFGKHWEQINIDSSTVAEQQAENLFQAVWNVPENWIIAPGFVDIHIHGMSGKDVMDGSVESLEQIAKSLVHYGVTSWLGTTMTMSTEKIQRALSAAQTFMTTQQESQEAISLAKLAGIHLEGPYISPKLKGAQDATYILEPDAEQFERDFYQSAPLLIKHLTCAPEMPGAIPFIENLASKGISVALGHSGCSFDEALAAKAAGAKHITHFFNGMPQTHHREPGLVGAGLMTDLSIEWIADGVHFREEWFSFLLNHKKEKSILVTDAMCAAGLCPGHYDLGGQDVVVDETSARLTSGVLAGSILTMDQAVKNMARNCPKQLGEILYAASTAPATLVGLEHVGRIEKGYSADAVALNEQLEVMGVWINGNLVFWRN